MKKRLLSLILACIMLFSLLPVSLADEGDGDMLDPVAETEAITDGNSTNASKGQTEQNDAPSNESANEEEQESETPANEPEQEMSTAVENDSSDAPSDEQQPETLINAENGSAENDTDKASQPVEIILSLSKLKDVQIANGVAEFVVKATCNQTDAAITYQWQQLDITGPFSAIEDKAERAGAREAAWKDMKKEVSNKLFFTGIEEYSSFENLLFRCRVTAGDVVVYTEEVKLLPEEKQAPEPVQSEAIEPGVEEMPEKTENSPEPPAEVPAELDKAPAADPEIVVGQPDDATTIN